MRRIVLAFVFLIMFSSSGLAGDLSANPVLYDSMVISNKRAADAAAGYARALFPEDSAEYSAHLKKALNSAVLTTHNVRLKDLSFSAPAEVTISIFDEDPRYRTNMNALVYGPGLDKDHKVWNGLPTKEYLNTVIITGASRALCSGTAVAQNAVLTAQHCHCDGVNKFVAVGERYNQHPGVRVAKSIPMKPCGSPISNEADVALLILEKDLDLEVVPAIVATKKIIDAAKIVRVVGFGCGQNQWAGQKRFVDVPMATPACSGSVKTGAGARMTDSTYYRCNKNFEFVAGAPLLDKDACFGDSGGPAFVKDNSGNDYLAGATSRPVGTPGARPCGDGSIYVRVDGDVADWITKHGVKISIAP